MTTSLAAWIAALFVLVIAEDISAATCRSVGTHLNGKPVRITRKVTVSHMKMTLGGVIDGQKMPKRVLPCFRMKSGLFCGRTFGPVEIAIMTNGAKMIERVTDPATKEELGGGAYVCDRSF